MMHIRGRIPVVCLFVCRNLILCYILSNAWELLGSIMGVHSSNLSKIGLSLELVWVSDAFLLFLAMMAIFDLPGNLMDRKSEGVGVLLDYTFHNLAHISTYFIYLY